MGLVHPHAFFWYTPPLSLYRNQTILSASVTVGESGDAVTVHVTGQIGWMGAALYIVDSDELWRIDDPTAPGSAVLEGSFPSGLGNPQGVTSHGGALYVVDKGGEELWRIDDPTAPGSAVLEGSFPSGLTFPEGITSHGGALYVVDDVGDELWRIDDPTAPGSAVLEGSFPSGLVTPQGITAIGAAPCMIRLARGTTEIEGFDLEEGRILFDATFTDAPGVGTHTYSLQMRTQDPNTLCTAYRGGGAVPMPSLLVQSYYDGVLP